MLALSPISTGASALSLVVAAGLILWSVVTSDWRGLCARRARLNLWLAATVALGLFWGTVGITLDAAVHLHPLLMTSFSLIFGFRLSLLGGTLALILCSWLTFVQLSGIPAGHLSAFANPLWQNFSYNTLLGVALPAGITVAILRALERWQVQNLFIYTLGVSFAGGILTMLLTGACSLIAAHLFNELHVSALHNNSHLFLLLAFPEGFCNGAIISTLAVLAPELVKTYNHDFYLK